ncbi:flagellin [Agrobacterium sp. NPDC089420]|uniref:flagellin N-terminal helical domain-containing protein n=1 Tax=Agrobacterium sp. NPDC089420 TaxID=3363918 RepID=UPI00384C99AF
MTSILTNTAAMSALQTLRAISGQLEETQSRVSSGMRVKTASDNAAYWSIATTMRSDNLALSAVQDALGLGAAKIDVAYSAMESAVEVVKEIKSKIVAATEEGVDKTKIQEEIDQLKKQLESISQGASFSGENWLLGTGAKTVVSGFTRDGSGSVSVTKTDYTLVDTTTATETANVIFGLTGTPATVDTTKGIIGQAGTASGISVWDIDLKLFDSATPPAYTIGNLLTDVETAFQSLSSASSALGSIKMRIGLQEDFVSKLTDSIDSGIGRLVDADMNEESTRLKALQTQQQLAIQSLSIANTNSENILSLFRQ